MTAGLGRALTLIFAIGCGAAVANIYYAQPLIGPISATLGLHGGLAGLVVTLTQCGYGAGMILLVPLADLVENCRLIQLMLGGAVLGLAGTALAPSIAPFLLATFLVGMGSTAAQVMVPFAVHLAPDNRRGRVIGNVMAGLIAGIMLARPVSSLLADRLGWRAVFGVAACGMLVLSLLLGRVLPRRQPAPGMHYGQILGSMGRLLGEPVLRRRAAYQGLVFCAFNLFWTAVPLLLAHRFGLSQRGIALFALAGAGGALAAPLAGRVADRGWILPATGAALGLLALSLLGSVWAAGAGSLVLLTVCAVVLDAAVQTNQIVGQRAIYALSPAMRGRLNAVYMTIVFACGALGSLLATATYVFAGWRVTMGTGVLLALAGLVLLATERRGTAPNPLT